MTDDTKLFDDMYDVSLRAAAHFLARGQWMQATRWAEIAWKLSDRLAQGKAA